MKRFVKMLFASFGAWWFLIIWTFFLFSDRATKWTILLEAVFAVLITFWLWKGEDNG